MRIREREYKVKVMAYYKVAMEHKDSKDEIEDEAFEATDRLFDDYSEAKVIKSKVTEIKNEKHLTIAEVTMDLTVSIDAYDYDEAMGFAEDFVEEVSLPVGVTLYEKEAYEVWDEGVAL